MSVQPDYTVTVHKLCTECRSQPAAWVVCDNKIQLTSCEVCQESAKARRRTFQEGPDVVVVINDTEVAHLKETHRVMLDFGGPFNDYYAVESNRPFPLSGNNTCTMCFKTDLNMPMRLRSYGALRPQVHDHRVRLVCEGWQFLCSTDASGQLTIIKAAFLTDVFGSEDCTNFWNET